MADLFRVIWAFEQLQTLRLAIIEPFKQPGIPVDEIVKRHPQICCNLHTVTIVGVRWYVLPTCYGILWLTARVAQRALLGLQDFPPLGCFGTCLTSVTLFWAQELGTMPSGENALSRSTFAILMTVTLDRCTSPLPVRSKCPTARQLAG